MDKIKKFLKDNKGCPLTTPAIKQLLVKFIELMSEGTEEVYEVDNIKSMSDDLISGLKVGDVVQKKTGQQKHLYIVTYKEENHGICLSYYAAGYLETVSYDYTNGHWVYNSTDVSVVPDIPIAGNANKFIGVNSQGTGLIAMLPSELRLLSSCVVQPTESFTQRFIFQQIPYIEDYSKTLLILTMSNCFVFGMISQTGKGRVAGLMVYDNAGNARLGHFSFDVSDIVTVDTDILFDFTEGHFPTAYLFALSIK